MSAAASVEIDLSVDGLLRSLRKSVVLTVENHSFLGPREPVVYILGWSNGVVKIGQTGDWYNRVKAHRSDKRVRGYEMDTRWWMRSSTLLEDEAKLVAGALALRAERLGGREWFTNMDPAMLIAAAEVSLKPAPKPPLSYYFPDWKPEDFAALGRSSA